MKHYGKLIIFQKQSEIDFMERYDSARKTKTIKFKKFRIMFPCKKDFTEAFRNYGEHFMAMSVEIFMCLFAFIGLLCWFVPYIGVERIEEK